MPRAKCLSICSNNKYPDWLNRYAWLFYTRRESLAITLEGSIHTWYYHQQVLIALYILTESLAISSTWFCKASIICHDNTLYFSGLFIVSVAIPSSPLDRVTISEQLPLAALDKNCLDVITTCDGPRAHLLMMNWEARTIIMLLPLDDAADALSKNLPSFIAISYRLPTLMQSHIPINKGVVDSIHPAKTRLNEENRDLVLCTIASELVTLHCWSGIINDNTIIRLGITAFWKWYITMATALSETVHKSSDHI